MPATLGDLARLGHRNNLSETADADLLAMMQQHDPNARWLETGTNDGYGYRLDYDPSKLPQNAVNGNRGVFGTVPVYDDRSHYHNASAFKQDDNYGEITDSRNYKPPTDWLDKYGPMLGPALVSMVAPMAGAALFGAGIGGGTSAITGAAAGLGAGNIATGGTANWLTSLARRAPQLARSVANGDRNALISALINSGTQGLGLPSWSGTAINTLGSIARRNNGQRQG